MRPVRSHKKFKPHNKPCIQQTSNTQPNALQKRTRTRTLQSSVDCHPNALGCHSRFKLSFQWLQLFEVHSDASVFRSTKKIVTALENPAEVSFSPRDLVPQFPPVWFITMSTSHYCWKCAKNSKVQNNRHRYRLILKWGVQKLMYLKAEHLSSKNTASKGF